MPTFCKLPWQGLDISPQGGFKPCCKYNRTIANTLDEYIVSDELSKLKQAFINGEQPAGCSRCWQDEAANMLSKRQLTEQLYLTDTDCFDNSIKILGFAFGNICNLECRYCQGGASSKWNTTAIKLSPIIPNIPIFKSSSFYKDEDLMNKIAVMTKDATYLEFAGGEPFYSGVAEHKHYLKMLLDNDPHCKTLQYITNVTTFPDQELIDLWSHFKTVIIQLSLDGIEKQFEYMRFPAKWDIAYANIKQYQLTQSIMPNLQLSISHTVGILNVYQVADFIEWCNLEKLPMPYCGMVSKPNYFCIRNLPIHVKEKIQKHLAGKGVDNIISYLMEPATEDFTTLRNLWITEVDKLRLQSYSEYFPEFSRILYGNLPVFPPAESQ